MVLFESPSYYHLPFLGTDGQHHVTETGNLLVLSVSPSDGLSRYQCRALNTVTGATRLSRSAARIIVAGEVVYLNPLIIITAILSGIKVFDFGWEAYVNGVLLNIVKAATF